ncbi:hypothetical protein FUT69_03955 [Xylella taiwanensis]|uniref:Uncharacterized protein n=1 Tax=Xylella taiwanensis TaxID=1444770 RepID=Z9JNU5_9GAMM|nr:hypothetical protein [Xylella taiwanensis]AXI84442.1 hypothetical protein AB672_11170 [Xylella taiwanensis]EWS79466.1 hypothetical protein AF72_00945 [Xylella taiwanensis]MCD8455337.1 hypothetical protein [Xylella taiwanensis]MCD8457742.1 hypothetical protein [Xylella taiwanensis]MCD8459878.1 hypothetical protein [Xylella taiwanensis]
MHAKQTQQHQHKARTYITSSAAQAAIYALPDLNLPSIGWRAKRHVDDALNGSLYTAIDTTDNPIENKKLRSTTLNRWRQRQYNRHDHQQRLAAPPPGLSQPTH